MPIAGYNIYLLDRPDPDTAAWKADPGTPFNGFPYPGDTDGDRSRESFQFENLVDGREYFAFVRTAGPDGRQSESSETIAFMPLGKGVFVISSDRTASNGGYCFERGTQTPGRDPRNDLYLYATENRIGLSSPNRLAAGLRRTRFSPRSNSLASEETMRISKGDKLTIKTRYGLAEIEIKEILGKYPDISVRIGYVFYPGDQGKR